MKKKFSILASAVILCVQSGSVTATTQDEIDKLLGNSLSVEEIQKMTPEQRRTLIKKHMAEARAIQQYLKKSGATQKAGSSTDEVIIKQTQRGDCL